MSTAMLERPAPAAPKPPADTQQPAILPTEDTTPSSGACPVCGSGATYQIMSGRWGCTACGATWAGGYTY